MYFLGIENHPMIKVDFNIIIDKNQENGRTFLGISWALLLYGKNSQKVHFLGKSKSIYAYISNKQRNNQLKGDRRWVRIRSARPFISIIRFRFQKKIWQNFWRLGQIIRK